MENSLRLVGIRGATCVKNEKDSIQSNVCELYREILSKNELDESNIVSVNFTLTGDITKLNPATALRKENLAQGVALFCSLEPAIENSLPLTVRILILAYSDKKPSFIYKNGAEKLRPDLIK